MYEFLAPAVHISVKFSCELYGAAQNVNQQPGGIDYHLNSKKMAGAHRAGHQTGHAGRALQLGRLGFFGSCFFIYKNVPVLKTRLKQQAITMFHSRR